MIKSACLALCLFVSTIAYSQQGEWTWIDGTLTPNPVAVFGTQGVSAPANHPAGSSGGCRWTDLQGNFWMFGGSGSGGFGAALWKYDVSINEWTWMKGPTAFNQNANYGTMGITSPTSYPGSRWLAAHWTDNNGNFWMYGGDGYTPSGPGLLTDLWKYEVATNNWTWMGGTMTTAVPGSYGTQGIASTSNFPPSTESAACWCDHNNNLWMFGGLTSGAGNTLWKYDIAAGMWTWIRGASVGSPAPVYGVPTVSSPQNDPGARTGMSSWLDAQGNCWLYGGENIFNSQGGYLADLWKYNIASNEWTWMNGSAVLNYAGNFTATCDTSGNAQPDALHYALCTWTDSCSNLWMYGGSSTYTAGNLWCYRRQANSWIYVAGNGPAYTSANYGTMMVSSPQNHPESSSAGESWIDQSGKLWMYGGNTTYPDVMWRFVPDYTCIGNCGEVTSSPGPGQFSSTTVTVYPTPTKDVLKFQFAGAPQTRVIVIYDLTGNEIRREETEEASIDISLQDFSAGIYFYSIRESGRHPIQGKLLVE